MKHLVHAVCQKIVGVALVGAGVLASAPLRAQPSVVSLAPARNATIARDGTVSVGFSTALQASAATALRLFGTQRGGSKAGVATVSGSQLTFKPTTGFVAGEKLWLTLDRHLVYSTSQVELARSQVWQLTAAATGSTGQLTPSGLLDWTAAPSLLTTGDVNGDGYPDVLAIYTTNGDYSSTLSIRLNDGTGTYAAIADQKLPYYVSALALGDLDADGDLDLVAAGARPYESGYYSVLLNQGGVLTTSTQVTLPFYVPQNSLELADVDADGRLDIIMPMKYGGTSGTNVLAVRLNNNGSFTNNATALLAGTFGSEVAVGDLDGDGDLDILTADASGKLVMSLNSGYGTFTSNGPTISTIAGYPQKLCLADLDGDSDLDVLLASTLPQVTTMLVRLNNGNAGFTAGTTFTLPDAASDLTLADLDGDGDQDLLYCYGQHVASQFNTGRATFGPGTDVVLAPTLRRLAISDIDGDGDLDALTSGLDYGYSRSQVVLLRNGPAAPAAYVVAAVAPAANRIAARTAPVAATFTASLGSTGAAGLRVLGSLGPRVAGVVTTAGNTLTSTPAAAYLPGELLSVTATKAVRSAAGVPLARPYVWQFTAAATGGNAQFGGGVRVQFSTLNNYPQCLKLADIDGDRDLDIITSFNASSATNYDFSQPLLLSVQLNDGQGRFAAPVPLLGAGVSGGRFALADVDGDGDLDYLGWARRYDSATSSSTNLGSVWLNDGRGTFAARGKIDNASLGIYGSGFAWGVGDLDGDGDPDLMNGGVRLNDGQGNFYGGGALANVDYVRGSVLADLDNDGDLDCITSTDAANDHFVHLNDGTGTLTQGAGIGTKKFGEDLLVRDIDGDGDMDLITGGSGSFYTFTDLWLNDGQAKFSRGLGIGGYPLAAGDLDGDGDVDIVTLDGCFLNNGNGTFGAARSATLATQDIRSELGDLDGDGDLDYVGVSNGSQGWTVRFNAGQTLATAAPNPTAGAVWPNPVAAGGVLTIGLPGPGAATLTLRTLLGQLVWAQPVRGASPSVPVGSVPPGVYLLTWTSPGQAPITQRLTVE